MNCIWRHFIDNENEKFSVLPASSHGSLSSITTTSIASSEDPKGVDDDNGKGFDGHPSRTGVIKQEEWWKTTLQVSIPFLVAGIGTIGAGVILGRVEVSLNLTTFETAFRWVCKQVRQVTIDNDKIVNCYQSLAFYYHQCRHVDCAVLFFE